VLVFTSREQWCLHLDGGRQAPPQGGSKLGPYGTPCDAVGCDGALNPLAALGLRAMPMQFRFLCARPLIVFMFVYTPWFRFGG